jgi:diguanylate cyclase (GGDEF)-like protein
VSSIQIFLLISAAAAALIGIVAAIVVWRERRRERTRAAPGGTAAMHPTLVDAPVGAKYDGTSVTSQAAASGAAYAGVLRILWWLTIAVVLVGVGISGAYASVQPAIFALGGAAVIAVITLHELLPVARRSATVLSVEMVVALGLVTGLILLTGRGESPFFFGYAVVAVAAALAHGGRIAVLVSALATLAYVGVLLADPGLGSWSGLDLLQFGLNIGSVWLLAYLAAVFAVQERRMRSHVLELSRTDPLTTLFNRSQLAGTLEQEVSRTRRSDRGFCLLMIDLDGLKTINDTLGHHRGDEVLRAVGGVIRGSIRNVDTAYRFGGDEFLVLLPETDIAGAFVVAEKIRSGAEEVGLSVAGNGTDTSVSIGLVSHPEDGLSADELRIAADRAMYQAKSLGKNQISGNPRPRRLIARGLPAAEPIAVGPIIASEPPAEPAPPTPAPEVPPAAAPPSGATNAEAPHRNGHSAPAAAPPAAGPPAAIPILAADPPASRPTAIAASPVGGDEEPDPTVVRRQIAAARLTFDPDDQIRRAMDAFLSTPRDPGRGPDA